MKDIAAGQFHFRNHLSYSTSLKLSTRRYSPYVDSLVDPGELLNYEYEAGKEAIGQHFSNVGSLGPFEVFLIEKALMPLQRVVCVVGARGSGKTSTIKRITSFMQKHSNPETKPFTFTFDANFVNPGRVRVALGGHDWEGQAHAYINRELPAQLLNQLLEYQDSIGRLIARYLSTKTKRSRAHHFENLIDSLRGAEPRVAEELSSIITQHMDSLHSENRLDFCVQLLSKIIEEQESKVRFICIDNIDQFTLPIQTSLVHGLNALAAQLQLTVLLPVRLITYNRLEQRALTLVVYPHCGTTPLQTIFDRGEEYLRLRKKSDRRDKRGHAAFIIRVAGIYSQIRDNQSFRNALRAIAGLSVQRGLNAISRLFVDDNNLRDLSEILTEDDIEAIEKLIDGFVPDLMPKFSSRVLSVSGEATGRNEKLFPPRNYHYMQFLIQRAFSGSAGYGPIIENLYRCKGVEGFSSIKVYILNLLEQARIRDSDRTKTIEFGVLIDKLESMGYAQAEIVASVNSLHDANRRLIWHDGRESYRNYFELEADLDRVIGLTTSGIGYLDYLAKDPDYFGFCTAKSREEKELLRNYSTSTRLGFLVRLCYDAISQESTWLQEAAKGERPARSIAIHRSDNRLTFVSDWAEKVISRVLKFQGRHIDKVRETYLREQALGRNVSKIAKRLAKAEDVIQQAVLRRDDLIGLIGFRNQEVPKSLLGRP